MSAPNEQSAIIANGLTVGKGGVRILNDLSFEMPAASFTALVGANGAGKTTLFETLLGLVEPHAGSVRVLDQLPARARQRIAYVPQAVQLSCDAHFLGRDFVAAAYRGHRWGMPLRPRAVARAVDSALASIGAESLGQRRLAALSGGQRQRLMVAQALVNQPGLLLMDEPLAQLDPAAQHEIVELAAHLRDVYGISVLFSTHDVNPVVGVTDHVLYLACCQGRIGHVDEIITDQVLTELYGVPMHVVRERGQIFVMRDTQQDGAQPEVTPLESVQRVAS
ncbi:ATP-binding cassette domain-containing protein [Salinisphaera sp. USBA-960]|nr:ATP-binding cassette domain-containing protein [Salifodinibacter halophilus]NNC27035.1 ATP-binding cassette domain-containing protein [Salifodinibacter halophilus]